MPYLRLVESGDQLEVYEYATSSEFIGGFTGKKRAKRSRSNDSSLRYRRADNVRRLKRDFTRLVRANLAGASSPALFTLTMFEVVGVREAYRAFTVFNRNLARLAKRDFRYVAVPEFQKRGAVHFHALVWNVPDEWVKNERNTRRIQNVWQRGFVDCVPTDGSSRLAGYLAKYMSKAMQDERLVGQKAYTATRNVLRPMLFKAQEEFDDVSEYFLDGYLSTPLQDLHFETQWLGKGRYRLYKK